MNNDFENRNENMENVPNTAVPNEMPAEAVQAPEAAAAPHATENPFDDTPVQAAQNACPGASDRNAEANAKSEPYTSGASGTPYTNVSYHPQSNTYSYCRPDGGGAEQVNGCAWNNTGAPVHTKPAKTAKKSSKGFKVFAASMLTVFTISAVAIASFMAVDFVKNGNTSGSLTTDETPTPPTTQVSGTATLLSSFKETEEGLTKSQVAAKCTPSTVGIVVEAEVSGNNYYGYFGNFYSQPQITQGTGSGFIYSADGYIITNHHVVEGANKITVYLSDDTQVEATLVGSDELSDIAVIKIDPTGLDLVPMEIGDSDRLVVGDEVIAIGCPAGIQFRGTVTDGIISAINRNVQLSENSGSKKTMTLLQTNATINKGNSGGPLINAKGQVIGINTLKLTSEYEGIGFSIPINGALPIISQLIEYGTVKERPENDFVSGEGLIGISASNITASEAEYYDIPQGVLVVQINKDGNAAKAGLRRGDIITAYNGTDVKTVTELNNLKASNKAGDEVTLKIYRDSDEDDSSKTFEITFKLDAA